MKFSIRDLLWLLMVSGLFFAWAMDRQRADDLRLQFDQMEESLASKDVELNRVTDRLRLEEVRVKYYRSGTIGYHP